jgi:hypothetical protein
VPGAHAARIAAYLKVRAAGGQRAALIRKMKLPWSVSTLVCVEWNALTYAGHTVWNVHKESGSGTKRRPREE